MHAGYAAFAENRPQELVRKTEGLSALGIELPRFDMIGNLQTNKVNQVLGRAHCIQSVSSYHLAEAVSKRAEAKGEMQDVLVEVNVSGEQSKSGFTADEVAMAAEDLNALVGIRIRGLMTMAPRGELAQARVTFEAARKLAQALELEHGMDMGELSYGMSDDFEAAIEEGATMVRLGRIVFDPNYL
jgi:pyridoxal phosphate enzyme (YggS family)